MKAWIAVGALLFGLAGTTQAQARLTVSRARLLQLCSSKADFSGCEAFLNGVSDASDAYQQLAKRPRTGLVVPREICVPDSESGVQLREAAVAWLQTHPGDRDQPAALIVLQMLHSNFPCK